VSWLAALEACPHVPPRVHLILVHPLELLGQQHQLVLSKHVELLMWQRHQRGQREHPGGWVLTVKFRQPSHEFTFDVGMTFVSYPLVLTPVV
jgi:hypothetical protein